MTSEKWQKKDDDDGEEEQGTLEYVNQPYWS